MQYHFSIGGRASCYDRGTAFDPRTANEDGRRTEKAAPTRTECYFREEK